MVDFVKEDVNIALALVNAPNILKLTPKAAGGTYFVGFSKLS